MRRFRRQFQQHQFCWHSKGKTVAPPFESCRRFRSTFWHFALIWLPLSETTVVQTRMLKEISSVRHSPKSRFVQVI